MTSDHAVETRAVADVQPSTRQLTVLVYSSDAGVRDRVRASIGRRPAAELGKVEYLEAETGDAVVQLVDTGGIDVAVLDAEAWPTGGMGLSRQIKYEIQDAPATLVIVARRDDVWLARWSIADAVVAHPLDPIELADAVGSLLRQRVAGLPVQR
jgi:DNA-binding response OmpR family regulator